MGDDIKRGVLMIAGVNEALKYKKQHQGCSDEEIMKHIMRFMDDQEFKKHKVNVIAGVAHVLKMVAREPGISDKQVIDRVMKEIPTLTVEN